MAQFLFVYHGGNTPNQTPEQHDAEMVKWQAWMDAESQALTDAGAPVGQSKTVSANGTTDDGGANPASGYSIVQAADYDAVCKVAQTCPIHEVGGTIEVAEIIEM